MPVYKYEIGVVCNDNHVVQIPLYIKVDSEDSYFVDDVNTYGPSSVLEHIIESKIHKLEDSMEVILCAKKGSLKGVFEYILPIEQVDDTDYEDIVLYDYEYTE